VRLPNPFRRSAPGLPPRDLPAVRRATLAEIAASRLGIGGEDTTSWSPTAYGHYYAQSVPVYAAIRMRSEAIAEAPIQVTREGADGDLEPVDISDPWQQLFRRMNPWWTQADVLTATEAYLMIWGAAFWFVEKSGTRPVAIWPLRSDRVRVIPGKAVGIGGENYVAGFAYRGPAGKEVPLLRDEVVWFRKFNPLDEFAGLSPIAPARLQFDSGKDAILFNRLFFSNGAHPDILFTVTDPVTDEQREEFLKAFSKRYKGVDKAYGALLWSTSLGPKPERLGLTHTEMQFLEGLRWTVDDASRVFDVPREMLGSGDITFANREMAERHFYRGTITREWTYLANEINEMLLPVLRAPEGYRVRFDTTGVRALHDSMVAREEGLLHQVDRGILTINEFREETGREPVSWGDRPFMPLTMVQIGDDGSTPAPDATSESWIEAFGDASVKALVQRERRFEAAQRGLFGEQRDSVIAALNREDTRSLTGFEAKQVPPVERIFDPTEWIRVFTRRGRPLIAVALTLAAREQANAFKLPPFNPDDPLTQKWLDERTDFWATRVNETTAQLLREEITAAAAGGEGIFEVRARVAKVFSYSEGFRAERIARTEMLAASSKGHVELYRQSGVVEAKRWIATRDDRVRETHLAAHGQIVGLNDKFEVGGELLDAPGIGGSPANTVNCRCVVSPVLRQQRHFPASAPRRGIIPAHVD
jgi:HK97 family phage portal protein